MLNKLLLYLKKNQKRRRGIMDRGAMTALAVLRCFLTILIFIRFPVIVNHVVSFSLPLKYHRCVTVWMSSYVICIMYCFTREPVFQRDVLIWLYVPRIDFDYFGFADGFCESVSR